MTTAAPVVLVLDDAGDWSAAEVGKHLLDARGVRWVLLDTANFPQRMSLDARLDAGHVGWQGEQDRPRRDHRPHRPLPGVVHAPARARRQSTRAGAVHRPQKGRHLGSRPTRAAPAVGHHRTRRYGLPGAGSSRPQPVRRHRLGRPRQPIRLAGRSQRGTQLSPARGWRNMSTVGTPLVLVLRTADRALSDAVTYLREGHAPRQCECS